MIEVSEYDDLRGDQKTNSKQKDRIIGLLGGDSPEPAVLLLEEWLCGEKTLRPTAGTEQIFAVELIAETEKAMLVSQVEQDDPDSSLDGVSWVPKSCSRLYQADGEVDTSTPSTSISDYGGRE